jgi:hypothetical protein
VKTALWVLIIALSVLLCAFCGYWFCISPTTEYLPLWGRIVIFVVLALDCYPLSIFLHEAAHGLCGKLNGMYVQMKGFDPFKPTAHTGISPFRQTHMPLRLALVTGAGMILNFILMVLGICGLIFPVMIWVTPVLAANFYLFVMNVVPTCWVGGKTDGLVLWELFTKTPQSQVLLAVMVIVAKLNSGTKIDELEESELMDLPQIAEDEFAFYVLTQLRQQYFEAVGDREKAVFYQNRVNDIKHYFE